MNTKLFGLYSIISPNYIISDQLHESLDKEQLIDSSNSDNGVYVIVFRVLNFKSNTLVYSYIHYNTLFTNILILFLLSRNIFMLNTYKEPGNFLSFRPIKKKDYLDKRYDKLNELSLSKTSHQDMSDILDNVNMYVTKENYIYSALGLISKLTYLSHNDKIAILVKMALNKYYKGFICNILGSLERWYFREDQKPQFFTNFELLNLENLNKVQLDGLGVKYEECDDNGSNRLALLRWRLDNDNHKPYINNMFHHIRNNKP